MSPEYLRNFSTCAYFLLAAALLAWTGGCSDTPRAPTSPPPPARWGYDEDADLDRLVTSIDQSLDAAARGLDREIIVVADVGAVEVERSGFDQHRRVQWSFFGTDGSLWRTRVVRVVTVTRAADGKCTVRSQRWVRDGERWIDDVEAAREFGR